MHALVRARAFKRFAIQPEHDVPERHRGRSTAQEGAAT